jgi:hypothetical protein
LTKEDRLMVAWCAAAVLLIAAAVAIYSWFLAA